MSSQNKLHSFVRSSMFIAAMAAGTSLWFGTDANGQAPADNFKRLEVKTKSDKEANDKAKEKDKALKPTGDKIDAEPIRRYYEDVLIPRLTHASPDIVNAARQEFTRDLDTISKAQPAALKEYNQLVISLLGNIVLPRDKVVYAPATRINAALTVTRLSSAVSKDGKKTPEALSQPMLVALIDSKEIDALSSLALTTLNKQLAVDKLVSENTRKQFFSKIKAFLDAPVPPARSADAHKFLMGQCIECLTRIALIEPEKDGAKECTAYVVPLLVKLMANEEESEWLLETACLSLGSLPLAGIADEDIAKLELGLARYARKSLRDWKKRIWMSSGALGGSSMGGYGAGGAFGGGDGYGAEGGGGAGMKGGMGAGSEMGGYGNPQQRRTNPYEAQPKEVKNARRIAHQRMERIHFALNGVYRKPETKPGEPLPVPTTDKGFVKIMPDGPKKENIVKLIERIEDFQTDLNDEKIADLTTLTALTGKAMKGLREICVEIMGEDRTVITTDESAKSLFGSQ